MERDLTPLLIFIGIIFLALIIQTINQNLKDKK